MQKRRHAVAILAVLLAACAPQVRVAPPEPPPAARALPGDFPREAYEQAAARGQRIYRIDPDRSLVAITVRRGGSLARLGHDHIVASRGTQGYVAPDEGRADIYLPLDALSVDEPALRAEAGFDTQPGESDIAGTRANMLDKVLDTARFPFALIHVSKPANTPAGTQMNVAITLRGVTRSFDTAALLQSDDAGITATGLLEFNQSDFGIVPFSILNGAIQVQDRLSLRFRILAVAYRPAP